MVLHSVLLNVTVAFGNDSGVLGDSFVMNLAENVKVSFSYVRQYLFSVFRCYFILPVFMM